MNEVKDMFDRITMPEETQNKILAAAAEKHNRIQRSVWKRAAAVAAVMVLMLALTPTALAAMERWKVKYFWPGSDITVYEIMDGEVEGTVAVVDTEAPAFARMVDGRLYFLGNGEKIDITDLITKETPYYYSYVDEYGLTHDMVVGYSDTIENFGIYEFIWKEEAGEKVWSAGTGRNILCAETETRYPWVEIVWEDLNIPWPMPE